MKNPFGLRLLSEHTIAYTISCVECGETNDQSQTSSSCIFCGEPLEVTYLHPSSSCQLPLHPSTPPDSLYLRPSEFQPCLNLPFSFNLYVKNEGTNRSGSFKDRGSFVEVVKAKELGKKTIVVASTGNMAASTAMYARRCNLECIVLVPATTSPAKLLFVEGCGAKLVKIDADYSTCEELAKCLVAESSSYFLAGDYYLRQEGQKQIAWEIPFQSQGINFDNIVMPIGCGTLYSAIGKGFKEMEAVAQVESKRPRLIGVQAEGSSAMIQSLRKGSKVILDEVSTAANATAVCDPIDYLKVKHYMQWSKGTGYTVSETSILLARKLLLQLEGIFVESAGALPLACLLEHEHCFEPNSNVLLLLTWHGLKDSKSMLNKPSNSPKIEAKLDAVKAYINSLK